MIREKRRIESYFPSAQSESCAMHDPERPQPAYHFPDSICSCDLGIVFGIRNLRETYGEVGSEGQRYGGKNCELELHQMEIRI